MTLSPKVKGCFCAVMSFIGGFISLGITIYIFENYKNIITVLSLIILSPIIIYQSAEIALKECPSRMNKVMLYTGQSLAIVLFLTAYYFKR